MEISSSNMYLSSFNRLDITVTKLTLLLCIYVYKQSSSALASLKKGSSKAKGAPSIIPATQEAETKDYKFTLGQPGQSSETASKNKIKRAGGVAQ